MAVKRNWTPRNKHLEMQWLRENNKLFNMKEVYESLKKMLFNIIDGQQLEFVYEYLDIYHMDHNSTV